MQVLWQRQLRKGHSQQQGEPAIFGLGGPIILLWTVRGDCPRRDIPTILLSMIVLSQKTRECMYIATQLNWARSVSGYDLLFNTCNWTGDQQSTVHM